MNGHPVDESYVVLQPGSDRVSLQDSSVTVPKGRLWAMGDNRYQSADSRAHGTVPVSDVVGRRSRRGPGTRARGRPAVPFGGPSARRAGR